MYHSNSQAILVLIGIIGCCAVVKTLFLIAPEQSIPKHIVLASVKTDCLLHAHGTGTGSGRKCARHTSVQVPVPGHSAW